MGIESWSTSAGSNNQAPPNGWPGGMLPSQVEPTGRQMMASIAVWYRSAEWINYNNVPTYVSATQFTMPGNVTSTFHVGRRVQATDGATSVYGTITVSAFTSLTTITVVWDTGVLQTGVTIVYVGITSKVNTSAPNSTSFANPTGAVGTAIVNGSATTAMRSDAAPAIDPTMSPNWTGLHNFGSQAAAGWYGGSGAIQIQHSGLWAFDNGSGNIQTELLTNAYQSALGTYKYSATAAAMRFGISVGGGFLLQYAASGSAGGTVTWTQALAVSQTGVVSGNDGTSAFELGYKDIPQNLQTTNYSPALSDRGKGVDFNGTSLTCTIPANASVAFPIGTTILITNLNATSLSIAITTDTLTLAGTTTTGTRTLGQNGEATLRKVTSTSWLASGPGLS